MINDELKKEFLKDLNDLDNNKVLDIAILPDLSNKGNTLAKRVLSVFGGNDLTFKGKCILKDLKDILDIEPYLIELVPKKHSVLLFEFLKQNLNNKYKDIIAIYNKKAGIK